MLNRYTPGGIFSGAALDALRQLTSDIEYIEQDKITSIAGVITQYVFCVLA